jgi:hypothetical protein
VTGGFVYHGDRLKELRGWYVFGDFESRRVWALTQKDRKLDRVVEIGRLPSRLVSFTQDADGELCCIGYDDGQIYRMVAEEINLSPLVRNVVAETSERVPVPWRFTTNRPAAEWARPDFDDSAWRQGPAGFGTAGTPGGEIRSEWRTNDIWIRRSFALEKDIAAGSEVSLRIHHDEDAEVYINGIEVARLNRWTTGYTEVPLSPDGIAAIKLGRNTLAVHCHQNVGGQFVDCGIVVTTSRAR